MLYINLLYPCNKKEITFVIPVNAPLLTWSLYSIICATYGFQ